MRVAQKIQDDGTPVYETCDIGNHGSSGAPVINAAGEIIGSIDRGADGSDTRVQYLVPSTVAAEYAALAGAANSPADNFMSVWTRAVDAYVAAK